MFTKEQLDHFKTKQVFIHTHDFPDPDAFASAFGLSDLLSHYGVKSVICYGGEIERSSLKKMLDTFHIDVSPRTKYDNQFFEAVNILVDSQLNNSNIAFNCGDDVYCIDHHPVFSEANYVWQDIRLVGACASIIVSYFKEADIPMSKNVASALCYGIKMDTNDFNRGCTQFDIDMFDEVFRYCDFEQVAYINQNQLVLEDFKAFQAALSNITTHGSVGFSYIPFSCPSTLVAIISDFLLSTEEVTVSVVYSRLDDVVKFSVRSEDNHIHAGNLVRTALNGIGNGGGHPTMAGGIIYKKFLDEISDLEGEVVKRFMKAYEGLYN